jgi:O-antigen/teichoic acid export membrane protein
MPHRARTADVVAPKGWVNSAATLAAVDILRQLDATYGILLIGALSGQAEAGYFRVAMSTIIIVATPLSVFNVVLAPTLARLHSEANLHRLQLILSVSAIAMFASALAALFVICVVGQPLIVAIFGQSYAPAWTPLVLLTIAQTISGFFGVGWVSLSMSGGERMLTKSFAISVAVSIIFAVPLIVLWGACGAAGAAIIGTLVQNLLAWRGVRIHSSLESSVAGLLWRTRIHPDAGPV